MMAAKRIKLDSASVSVKTFEKWTFYRDFEPEVEDGMVKCLRCKICSKNAVQIRMEAKSRGISGPPLNSIIKYIDGVTYVHKTNVEKHIKSGSLHDWAKRIFCSDVNSDNSSVSTDNIPSVQSCFKNISQSNYIHLFNTALSLVMAEKPFADYPYLINMQRKNGVKFISGKDDKYSCAIFVDCIADTIRNDMKQMLSNVNFMSGEMDGSEARKTKEEKELVYCKVVIRGQPIELLLKCQRMTDFGNVDANGTKNAFDDAFLNVYEVPAERFENLLVGVCADGASVNMGRISGACTQMKLQRPWLLVVHCVNHRLELAVGDSFKSNGAFKILDEMMVNVFYLFRNSGKNKRIIMRLAGRLSITWISFVNTKGTRFQAHHYRGIRAMIVNFLALVLFAENMIESDAKTCKGEVKAKLKGYLDQWLSFGYLGALQLYREVLKHTSHTSLVFQNQDVLITDVIDALSECKDNLQQISEAIEVELPFPVQIDDDNNEATLTATATNLPATLIFKERSKMTENQILKADKCITKVSDTFSLKRVKQGKETVRKIKSVLIPEIQSCINKRFESFDMPLYQAFRIADHSTWDCKSNEFGKEQVRIIAEHFQKPLETHKFNLDLALRELNALKHLKETKFKAFLGKLPFWERIFCDHFAKFVHFLLIIEICLTMSYSSSTVERGFSYVKRHLTDSRLSLTNKALDSLLVIRINVPVLAKLDPNYEEKLIQKAVKLYLTTSELKRGRYHRTVTTQSKSPSVTKSLSDCDDLFMPLSAATYINSDPNDNNTANDLLDVCGEMNADSESDAMSGVSENDTDSDTD